MTVDCHTHNFPDALAPRALAAMLGKLEGRLVPVGDGTLSSQLRDMDRCGVDLNVVCPVATRPGQFQTIFDRARAVRDGREGAAAAERLVQLCSVHPADPEFASHLAAVAAEGFRGVKLHPRYQGFALDDPRHFPYFEAVRDAGLFVIAHCGYDPGFVGGPPACEPPQIAALLSAVPGLKFVAAHLGGSCAEPAHAVDRLLPFPNCWLDTAVINLAENTDEARRIVREWPADRLVFGTDYFWRDPAEIAAWVRSNRPDAGDLELMFCGNARRLLGL